MKDGWGMAVGLRRGILLLGIAICAWSLSPLLIVRTIGMAPAPVVVALLAVIVGSGFAALATTLSPRLRPTSVYRTLRREALLPSAFLLGLGAFVLYPVLYFSAIQTGPPVLTNLVNYLWPVVGMVLVFLRNREERSLELVIGGAFGLAGAALAITSGASGESYRLAGLTPFLLAAAGALVYGAVSAYMRAGRPTRTVPAPVFLLGALWWAGTANVCLLAIITWWHPPALALSLEPARVAGLLMYAALLPLAHLCWLTAIENRQVPAFAAAYLVPVAATALLAFSTTGLISPQTLSALVLVLCGIAFASSQGIPVAFAVLLSGLGSIQVSQAISGTRPAASAEHGDLSEVMVSLVAIFGGFVLSNAIGRFHALQRACAAFYEHAAVLARTSPHIAAADVEQVEQVVLGLRDVSAAPGAPDLAPQWIDLQLALENKVSGYEWLVLALGSGGLLLTIHTWDGQGGAFMTMLSRAVATGVIVGVMFAVRDYDLHRPDRLAPMLRGMRARYGFAPPSHSALARPAAGTSWRPWAARVAGLSILAFFSVVAVIQNSRLLGAT